MPAAQEFFWVGIPVFAAFVALEFFILWRQQRAYSWQEGATSLALGIGNKLSATYKLGFAVWATMFVWEHRAFEVPLATWWGPIALFVAVEFSYYWFHRLSHEIRWMWATHAVHHSPNELNILAAFRLGWTGSLSGQFLVYLPIIWLGFHPVAVGGMLALNLLYQSWIHTDLIGKLGWFDRVFNSPSNHRVHHASNPDYIDRNYGGVLIIFDRMFGTYVEERADEPCRYGLVQPLQSHNPLWIAFHEWVAMVKDVLSARSLREVVGYMFGPPGWKPDAARHTNATPIDTAQPERQAVRLT
jgi:sterol desaturase/sphingolipid hydroxylase (fatty acid hydroxylase superfamily)